MKCTGAERTHVKTNAMLCGSICFLDLCKKRMQMGLKKCPKPFILNGLERLSVFLV